MGDMVSIRLYLERLLPTTLGQGCSLLGLQARSSSLDSPPVQKFGNVE